MKSSKLSMVLVLTLASTLFLTTACLEEKKKDDASTDTDGGGGGSPAPTPTLTCNSPSAGFSPMSNGGYITNLTVGSKIKTITLYFQEHLSGNLGQSVFNFSAVGCSFNGSTLETISNASVITTQAFNFVKKTFTFSGDGITVPDCNGVGTVTFLFSSVASPNNSDKFFVGAEKTAGSSCQNTVATGTSGTPAAHGGAYSFSGEITQ